MLTFYELFTNLCYSKGVSPSKVCNEIGLSNATATQWKRGAKPSPKSLKLIADYFNMTTEEIMANLTAIDMVIRVQQWQKEVDGEIQSHNEQYEKHTKELRLFLSAFEKAPSHIKRAIITLLEIEDDIEIINK